MHFQSCLLLLCIQVLTLEGVIKHVPCTIKFFQTSFLSLLLCTSREQRRPTTVWFTRYHDEVSNVQSRNFVTIVLCISHAKSDTCEEQNLRLQQECNDLLMSTMKILSNGSQNTKYVQTLEKENSELKAELETCQMPRTCEDLYNQGFTTSGQYSLDFDGLGDLRPIQSYCQFPEKIAMIANTVEEVISNCQGPACHTVSTDLNENNLKQVKEALKSHKCHQNITIDCNRARIHFRGQNYLTYRDVNRISHDVEDRLYECNLNKPETARDIIQITDESQLPLSSASYGPLYQDGNAKVSIGPVVCKSEVSSMGYLIVGGVSDVNSNRISTTLVSEGNECMLAAYPIKGLHWAAGGGMLNGAILLCGGITGHDQSQSACYRYEYQSNSWIFLTNLDMKRGKSGFTILKSGNLWISGGLVTGKPFQKSTVIVSANGNLKSGPDLPNENNGHCHVRTSNNDIFVIGGWNPQTKTKSSVFIYKNDINDEIIYLGNGPSLNYARYYHACTVFKSANHGEREVAVVVGGTSDSGLNGKSIEVWDYQRPRATWEKLPDLPTPMKLTPNVFPNPNGNGLLVMYNEEVWIMEAKSGSYFYSKSELQPGFPRRSALTIAIPASIKDSFSCA